MTVETIEGDLLDCKVDAIVNPWNRNTIPWWLLLPQGVSGAIKRRGGTDIFKELARHGRLRLGQAVLTKSGRLPFKAIIHVAGINDLWRSSPEIVKASVVNACQLASSQGFTSVAMPLIGSGSGGLRPERSEAAIRDALQMLDCDLEVKIVRRK